MLKYFRAVVLVVALVLLMGTVLSVSFPGENSLYGSWPDWAAACQVGAGSCAQMISASVLSALQRLVSLWQSDTLATMGGSIILVTLMMMVRHYPVPASLMGALTVILLVSGFLSVAEIDWDAVKYMIAQTTRSFFTVAAVTALLLGTLMFFGMVLRGISRGISDGFVIRTGHSTPFPQHEGPKQEGQEESMVGDIDGDTGSIRISGIYTAAELSAANLEKNRLVRLTWLDEHGRRKKGSRPLYRRLRTLNGLSVLGSKTPLEIKAPRQPDRSGKKSEYPLCILHFEDKAKLFGYEREKISEKQRKKLGITSNDRRDFAELKIEKARLWDWFHYVFNHTDPAVAWSFRMGLAVSITLMVVQITFLEPILSPVAITLN